VGNDKHSQIGPYVLKQTMIFKCPADMSCTYGNHGTPRIRSYSMTQSIGFSSVGVPDGQGAWLPSIYNGGPWLCYFKESDLGRPPPSKLWLLIDEDPDSINDAAWGFKMPDGNSTSWVDQPSKLHGGAAGFGFVDGHAEVHAWANLRGISTTIYKSDWVDPPVLNGNRDIWWVGARSSALANGGFDPFPDN
jgi:prepilin-type processing-associated H-X9-DG protein